MGFAFLGAVCFCFEGCGAGGLKDYLLHVDVFLHEEGGAFSELLAVLGGEVLAAAAFLAALLHLRMAVQIVGQCGGHIFALCHDVHSLGHVLLYLF